MGEVERHKFVDSINAYGDFPLPIGEGQTISQPYIVAFMTEILKPDSTMKVLEIGTGSGYQAAVLAEICDSVYTVEIEAQTFKTSPNKPNSKQNNILSSRKKRFTIELNKRTDGFFDIIEKERYPVR